MATRQERRNIVRTLLDAESSLLGAEEELSEAKGLCLSAGLMVEREKVQKAQCRVQTVGEEIAGLQDKVWGDDDE